MRGGKGGQNREKVDLTKPNEIMGKVLIYIHIYI